MNTHQNTKGNVTNAVDPQWGLVALDWDVSIKVAYTVGVIGNGKRDRAFGSSHVSLSLYIFHFIIPIKHCCLHQQQPPLPLFASITTHNMNPS
jgi:hypothetical protein